MQIRKITSHLHGDDFLQIHHRELYGQLLTTIESSSHDDIGLKLIEDGWDKTNRTFAPCYLIKDRIAIEIQSGYSAIDTNELFEKHLAFYIGDQIDVGIEILPMKSLQAQMSSGVPYYEGELYNVVRQGRGIPAVPLVLVGIEP